LRGRLSYAASSQLAISFLEPELISYSDEIKEWKIPDGSHQTIHEEFIFLGWCFLPGIPNFAIASFHEPPF
jgi:hypothetical protein